MRSVCLASTAALVMTPTLMGCSASAVSAAEKAERELEMVSDAGATNRELCDAQKRVRVAWLKAEDKEKYEQWKLTAAITCRRADQQEHGID